ncbi:MAG TPA: S-layer homology domain-containing protein [Chloroflexia bacterium]|nr:S-layer homology domain-containing protein [Chloroflexia bacterium]
MRSRASMFALALLGLSAVLAAGAYSQAGPGPSRPPMLTPYPTPDYSKSLPPAGAPTPRPGSQTFKGSSSFMPVSLFGMNLYLTGLERSATQASTLGAMAAQGGVKWSREELSWANIEPNSKGSFAWATYDQRLGYDAANGINVVGMLLTTPRWASSNPTAPDWFWYEPNNQQDYFDFVRAAVTHWQGSIHVWEIWNEPDVIDTWKCAGTCNRAADYARLLQGAYAAVKSVDPNARVLIGGLSVHDTNNGGMLFLNQVVAASGGAIHFDGLSIHPYMPDRIPEGMRPDSVVQNYQYRLAMANDWINAHGGLPGEIWITEDGYSTCTTCPYHYSDDDQASFLARLYGIAAAMPRVVQFDYFQFEDKFNNPADLFGAMAIVRDDLSVKPGYNAYRTASQRLDGATYSGPGPQMVPGNNPQQPDSSDFIGFDYRFTRNGTATHMVWRVNDSLLVNYPVETAQVDVVDRDGGTTRVSASNGTIPLTISPRPQYIVAVNCTARFSDVCPTYWAYNYIEYLAARGIVSGYADGTFRPDTTATRAQLAKMIVVARGWSITTPPTPSFSDVPSSNPFYGYIETAKAHNVISGYADGTFRPGNTVTRAQICKMIVNAFAFATNTTGGPHFTDVPTSDPFYGYIETAYNRAIISGYADHTFRPATSVTRAQLSKMLYAAMTQP